MEKRINEKNEKKIIVIKKQKKLHFLNNINSDDFNSRSLTERKK